MMELSSENSQRLKAKNNSQKKTPLKIIDRVLNMPLIVFILFTFIVSLGMSDLATLWKVISPLYIMKFSDRDCCQSESRNT